MTSLANQGMMIRSFEGREGAVPPSMGKSLINHQVIHANDTGVTANRPLVQVRNDFLSSTGARRVSFTTDPNQITRRYVGHESPFMRRQRVAMGDINSVHYLGKTN